MNTEIFLLRHATPDWSRTDLRYDIPPGPPLTEQGRTEAHAAAEYLRNATTVSKILASPLDRTQQTAEVIGKQLALSVLIDSSVAEWRRGEQDDEVLQRMTQTWQLVVDSAAAGSVVVVTHGGPIRMLLQHLGVEADEINFYCRQFDRNNPVPPAGIWRASQVSSDAPWQVELVFTPTPHQKYVQVASPETATVYL